MSIANDSIKDEKENHRERNGSKLPDLLHEIRDIISSYVLLSRPVATLISCWIAGTYFFECFRFCGYLSVRSKMPLCGKTRLLRLISMLAFGSPPVTANPTPAILYRTKRSVWCLDEVDKLRNEDREKFGEVMAILNVGFEKGAVIERLAREDGDFKPKSFSVFGPKALAGIESLSDTLASRSFKIEMKRAPARMPRLNTRKLEPNAARIRKELERLATELSNEIASVYEELPDEVLALKDYDDRFQDIAEPLFTLVLLTCDDQLLEDFLKGLAEVAIKRQPLPIEAALITFLKIFSAILGPSNDSVFVSSNDLLAICEGSEDLNWIKTPRRLADSLQHFDLSPGRNSAGTERGYTITRTWLTEWGTRYKRPVKAVYTRK